MLSTQLPRPGLFQYLDNYQKGIDDLKGLSHASTGNRKDAVAEVEASLSQLSSIDQLIDKISQGEANASLSTVQDMLGFYANQVSRELNGTLEQYQLQHLPKIAQQEGKWQYLADSPVTPSEQQFVDYLNRDARLSKRVERLSALSELNELTSSQGYAKTLADEKIDEAKIEQYLFSTRSQVISQNFLSVQGQELELGNSGIAKQNFKALSEQEV